MTHISKVSFRMLCLMQWRMVLHKTVAAAAAAVLGCVGEFDGEPVVVVEFAAGLVGVALRKHPRLPEAGPVKMLANSGTCSS